MSHVNQRILLANEASLSEGQTHTTSFCSWSEFVAVLFEMIRVFFFIVFCIIVIYGGPKILQCKRTSIALLLRDFFPPSH